MTANGGASNTHDWRGPLAALFAIAGAAVLLYDTWTRWRLP